MQQERNLVVSETCDFIEFNEPTDALWDALTDDAQWSHLSQPKGGKGKGRPPKNRVVENNEERWSVLPEKPIPGNPYSAQMETTVVDMLQEAEKEVNILLQEQSAKKEAAEAKLVDLTGNPSGKKK